MQAGECAGTGWRGGCWVEVRGGAVRGRRSAVRVAKGHEHDADGKLNLAWRRAEGVLVAQGGAFTMGMVATMGMFIWAPGSSRVPTRLRRGKNALAPPLARNVCGGLTAA